MRWKGAAVASCAALLLAGCTGSSGHHHAAAASSAAGTPGRVVPAAAVSGLPATRATRVADTGAGQAPGKSIAFLSRIYRLTPSGPLPSKATVTVALSKPAPAGTAVVAATRESAAAAWTYLPAHLNADRSKATFTTTHFSLFGILGYDTEQIFSTFKSDFIDGLDSGATAEVGTRPSCQREADARAGGYTITSSSGTAVFWCFGVENGQRVLKVVDHRRYPLEVAPANMSVISNRYDHLQAAAVSRLFTNGAIIEAGGTATFNADLSPGGSEGTSTEMDGTGQSLYALQTGVESLVSILTRFGAGSGVRAIDAVGKAMQVRSCFDAFGKGSGAIVTGCLDPATILEVFGVKGLLLAPVVAAGGVVSFLHSEWNALIDQFNQHDQYRVHIARAAPSFASVAGQYYGHTRGLTVNADGTASEEIGDGCCSPVVSATYRLSRLTKSNSSWQATATITSVRVYPAEWQNLNKPKPQVGQQVTLSASGGKVTSSLAGALYCTMTVDLTGACGA